MLFAFPISSLFVEVYIAGFATGKQFVKPWKVPQQKKYHVDPSIIKPALATPTLSILMELRGSIGSVTRGSAE